MKIRKAGSMENDQIALPVVELKAISALDSVHFAIVRSYMKATNADSGLLLNFAAMPLTIKRVVREAQPTFLIS